jgi:hypothetical protein
MISGWTMKPGTRASAIQLNERAMASWAEETVKIGSARLAIRNGAK